MGRLRWPERRCFCPGDRFMAGERGPCSAERGLLARHQWRAVRLFGRDLPASHQELRDAAQSERPLCGDRAALERARHAEGDRTATHARSRSLGDLLEPGGGRVQGQQRGPPRAVQRAVSGREQRHRRGLEMLARRRHVLGCVLPGGRHGGDRDRHPGDRGDERDRARRRPVLERALTVVGVQAIGSPEQSRGRVARL